ncbi:hypothetical protein [Streptomyces sp. NPDC002825]|uniref:zinc finger domain-containing protein n=1 Tax=Streptomyces sp. NPDC002825 TaxID=3154666 RepID=UPI003317CF7B
MRSVTRVAARCRQNSTTAPPSALWTPGRKQKEPARDVQAHELMRRLLYARRTEYTDLAQEVCREIDELAGVSPQLQRQLDAARRNALLWAKKETEARRELFARLNQAMADQMTRSVKTLLTESKTATRDGRTEEEEHTIRAAAYLTAVEAATFARLDTLLADISCLPANEDPWFLKSRLEALLRAATGAGRIGEDRKAQLELWSTRLRYLPFPPRSTMPLRQQEGVPLHRQVGRAYWTTRPCPRCAADCGQQCVVNDGPRAGRVRQVPHADRLRTVINELQEQQKKHVAVRTTWRAYDVTCPDCGQEAGAWCLTPGEPHSSRSKRARKSTEQQGPSL